MQVIIVSHTLLSFLLKWCKKKILQVKDLNFAKDSLMDIDHILHVDKRYNLYIISLSPIYSLLYIYILFTEAGKSKTCNVLADDACCRRQFTHASDVTLLPSHAKAGMLAVAVACGVPNSNQLYCPKLHFSFIAIIIYIVHFLCTNLCIIQLGI